MTVEKTRGRIEVIAAGEAAVAEVRIHTPDGTVAFEGAAKTHPDDQPGMLAIGTDLALARALKKAAAYFDTSAWLQVKAAEDTRKMIGLR